MGWTFADIWEAIARSQPEQPALIQADRVITWAEFDARGEFVGVTGDTLVHSTPRDQLSPEQVKEWTRPVPFPIEDPPPPLPGLVPPSLPKWQEGLTVVPPAPPLPGFSYPEIDVPLYVEAEREEHHHIPQFLWNPRPRRNPDWKPKHKFSDDAIEVFDGLTVSVPKVSTGAGYMPRTTVR